MPTVKANGIDICYDTLGNSEDPAMLLVMGLGAQLIAWNSELCSRIADKGFFVIRYDNRDVGLSTTFDSHHVNMANAVKQALSGEPVEAPYTLSDMAADAVGLLDAIGVAEAHVIGASMGGMIAQTIAIEYPQRVLTLTSVMSTTGARKVSRPTPEFTELFMQKPADGRDGAIELALKVQRTIGSRKYFDEGKVRQLAAEAYDRMYCPAGIARQILAILASGNRTSQLRLLNVPTLVIHGRDDVLVPLDAGLATAEAIPGSDLLVLDDMGHDLPEPLWDNILDALLTHVSSVEI